MNIVSYIVLGLLAGIASGLLGIGGAVIIIPALIYIFGFTQHLAQGTTLALMVPPIGLLAAWTYYRQGYVDLKVAVFICLGFFIGGLGGAKIATILSGEILRRVFGLALLVISLHMIFAK